MKQSFSIEEIYREAIAAWGAGNLAGAESLAQELVESNAQIPGLYELIGKIALLVHDYERAARMFEEARRLTGPSAHLQQLIDESHQRWIAHRAKSPPMEPRYMLIREWGCGFCSDLNHVIGSLAIAEATGRIPIVFWGEKSCFRGNSMNGWDNFFEPVSSATIDDLRRCDFFPARWNRDNFLGPVTSYLDGRERPYVGFQLFSVDARAVVADVHVGVIDIIPWLQLQPRLATKPPIVESIYRQMIQKYIRPRDDILKVADRFYRDFLDGRKNVAIHLRGGDKYSEIASHAQGNELLIATLMNHLQTDSETVVFLMTDDQRLHDRMSGLLGKRMVSSSGARVADNIGLHLDTSADPVRLGKEILVDMTIASRCDRFYGNGGTNVAAMIVHWRNWAPEQLVLAGNLLHYSRNHLHW